jgi:hypothetical protein
MILKIKKCYEKAENWFILHCMRPLLQFLCQHWQENNEESKYEMNINSNIEYNTCYEWELNIIAVRVKVTSNLQSNKNYI